MGVIEPTGIGHGTVALPACPQTSRPLRDRTDERDGSRGPGRRLVEEQAQLLMDLVSQGVVVLDAGSRVVSCNERFATLLGLPLVVLLDATLDPYFSPREVAAFRALQVAGEDGERCGDFTLRHVDNSPVPVRISVSPFEGKARGESFVGAVVTDLRPERAARERMAAQGERLAYEVQRRKTAEDRLARALRAGGRASWECELGSGRAMQTVGMRDVLPFAPVGTWSRQALIDAFVASDRAAVAHAFEGAAVSGTIDIEARVAGPDADVRWLRIVGRVRADAAGMLAGFIGDVTALREDRETRRRSGEMEAVGQMAAGVAHDLNNFLQVIGNDLALLARRRADDAEVARFGGSAQRVLLRAARLTQQLLDLSRGQRLQLECLSLPELVASVRELLDRVLPTSVHLRVEAASELWACMADPYQLESALLNLSINARDAMPDGGVLSIAFGNRCVSVASSGICEGDYVMVAVADSGIGMPPDVVTRAFEPFFTTKAPGEGTGLGLSQVQAFVQRSNGFVTIETEVGRGSCVSLFFPRCPG
jgi:signal transduction histidine kinase